MAPRAQDARPPASPLAVWVALLIVYVVWGSTYLAIRVMVETMPPFLAAGIRFAIGGVVLAAVLLARGGPSRLRVSRAELASAALVGSLLLFIGNGLVSLGEQSVPSGLAALIVGVIPLIVLLLRGIAGEPVSRAAMGGVAMGFVGLAVLVVPRGLDGSVAIAGIIYLLIASTAWATGSFLSRRIPLPRDPFVSTMYQLLTAGVLLLAWSLVTGEWSTVHPADFSAASLWSLAYLIVFGSLVAYSAYTWLLQHAPISKVATYAYVNPVVAVALGALILGEAVPVSTLLGAAMIVLSVAFIVWKDSGPEPRKLAEVAEVAEVSEVALEPRAVALEPRAVPLEPRTVLPEPRAVSLEPPEAGPSA